MKTRYLLFLLTACLLILTMVAADAQARTITFTAKRCGSATVDPADLNDDPSSPCTVSSRPETLTSTSPTPLPSRWEGIKYSCNGYVADISLTTGNYKFASGVCDSRTRTATPSWPTSPSAGNKVEFQFRNGTGSWSGITGSGKGPGSMPFAGGGTGQQCSPVTIKIKTP